MPAGTSERDRERALHACMCKVIPGVIPNPGSKTVHVRTYQYMYIVHTQLNSASMHVHMRECHMTLRADAVWVSVRIKVLKSIIKINIYGLSKCSVYT